MACHEVAMGSDFAISDSPDGADYRLIGMISNPGGGRDRVEHFARGLQPYRAAATFLYCRITGRSEYPEQVERQGIRGRKHCGWLRIPGSSVDPSADQHALSVDQIMPIFKRSCYQFVIDMGECRYSMTVTPMSGPARELFSSHKTLMDSVESIDRQWLVDLLSW